MRYFVNTGESVDFYDTAEQAINAAEKAIEDWRDCCDPDWPDEVENVCWGPIHGESVAIDVEGGKYLRYELSEPPDIHRCKLCGGLVTFDGTKPTTTL